MYQYAYIHGPCARARPEDMATRCIATGKKSLRDMAAPGVEALLAETDCASRKGSSASAVTLVLSARPPATNRADTKDKRTGLTFELR